MSSQSARSPITIAATNSVAENAAIGTPVGITAFATDADGSDSVTYSLDDDAGGLFAIDPGTGVITVAGSLDYETATSHNVTVRATSTDTSYSTKTFSIDVNNLDDNDPTIADDSTTVVENASVGTVVYDVNEASTFTDVDLDGDTLTYTITAGNIGNAFTIDSGTGIITVNGAIDYETLAQYTLTVEVSDGSGATDTATITIDVNNINETTPSAATDSFTVAEGGTFDTTVTNLDSGFDSVLGNDTGLVDVPVPVTLVTDVTWGTLTLNTDGTFTYVHDGSENFTDSFTYRVTDNDGQTSDATVNITITPVSDTTPSAATDSFTVAEGGTFDTTVTNLDSGFDSVLGNDTGLVDVPVPVTLVTDVTWGTLTLNTDGTFTYVHDGSENFTDSFTYRVTDNDGQTSDATVNITITPVSDTTPSAATDSFTVAEGGTFDTTVTNLDSGFDSVLGNDTGLVDVPVPVTLVTDVTWGTLTLNTDGTFTYVHDGSENFTDSFTYRVTDNDGQTSDATVNITITPVSDTTPSAATDSFTVAEGGTFDTTVTNLDSGFDSVLGNDTGLVDVPVPVTLVTDVTWGTLTLNTDGTFTYVHDGSENFTDSFTYRVTDNDGQTSDATVNITITPVSDTTPSAATDSFTVAEGGTFDTTVTNLDSGFDSVLGNDTGLVDVPVPVTLVTDVTWGTLTLNTDGTFTYVHDGSENFTDSFTYRVTDNDGQTSDATVNITITPVSDTTPSAATDSFTVAEGGTFDTTVTNLDSGFDSVLGNDTGLVDVPVPVTLVTDVTWGTLTLNTDGTFTYVHDGSENFTDSFTYRVTDNDGQTSDATVNITITPVSDTTPSAATDSFTVAEGGTFDTTVTNLDSGFDSVLGNDTGLVDVPVPVTLVTDVTWGTLTLNTDGTFTYVHDGSENFTDSFTYRVTDNDGQTSDATVNITITPVSDTTPSAATDSFTVAEGGTFDTTVTNLDSGFDSVLGNDTGLVDVPVPVTLVTDVTWGTLTLNTDGTFTYVHDGSENFTDSFTYRVTDNDGQTSDATVNITITPVSDTTPSAATDSFTVAEGGTFDTTVTNLDSGFDSVLGNDTGLVDVPVPVTLVTDVTWGTLTLNTDGTFTYVHDGSENFTDSFTYRVTDNDGQTSDATVNITITPVSDTTPSAATDSFTVAEGGTFDTTVTNLDSGFDSVLGNDTGLVDVPVPVTLVTDVTWGTLTLNTDGTFTYVHDGSENFTDSFTYRVTDNDGQTSDATVNITITPVSDTTPSAATDSFTVAEGGTFDTTVTNLDSGFDSVLGNDTGLVDVPVPVTLVTDVTWGTLTLNTDGTFTYVHDGSENFTDSFTYRVTDNDGQTSDATVNITITPVSDTTPSAATDSFTVAEGGTFDTTVTNLDSGFDSVLGNDTGLVDVPVPVTLVTDVTWGTLTLNTDGTFTYVHDGSENFTDSFTYRVTDNDGQTSDATVNITITPVSDTTPSAATDSFTVAEGGTFDTTVTNLDSGFDSVLGNDTGLVDVPVPVTLVTDVTWGTLTLNTDGTFTYVHDGSENFTDSFTYRVTDNDGQTSDATVNITITPVNDNTPSRGDRVLHGPEGGTSTPVRSGYRL